MILDVGIKAPENKLSEIVKCTGELVSALGEPQSSGFGFGIKDMQWKVTSRKYNDALMKVREIVKKHNLELDYPLHFQMMLALIGENADRVMYLWHLNAKLKRRYKRVEDLALAILNTAIGDWEESYTTYYKL